MAKRVQILRYTTAEADLFTPLSGELIVDTQRNDIRVGDGSTAGGNRLANLTALGSVFQPLDADLTAIAALSTTSLGRGVLAVANDAAMRAYMPFPTNHIGGLRTANNVADAANDIDIAIGTARDASDTANMILTSALVKRLDANWAVGTNEGGLDTGSKANSTTYAVWLITRTDLTATDVLFSTSFTAPTMPANYTYKRLIGAIRTASGGNILPYLQVGNHFQAMGDFQDVNDSTIVAGTPETAIVWCPPYCTALLGMQVSDSGTGTTMQGYIRTTGNASTAYRMLSNIYGSATNIQAGAGPFPVLVNGSSQVDYAVGVEYTASTVIITNFGFIMNTRTEPV